MKKLMALLALVFTISGIGDTQANPEAKNATGQLVKCMELQMPDGSGHNGAGVAWDPIHKIYYAAFAGNTSYPLAVFDSKGNRISKDDLEANFDVRGIWYNSKRKTIQMNGYDDFGWSEYSLDNKGFPVDLNKLFAGMNQPSEQSTGAFDESSELVYFLNKEGDLEYYDINTSARLGTKFLYLNCVSMEQVKTTEKATEWELYNQTTVMYTGIKDAEFALLFADGSGIVCYSKKTGLATRASELPDDAPVNKTLNVSYANGIFWLFDVENRKWIGYR